MAKGIDIPVRVTGAEQAKQDLAKVGQTAAAVGGAESKSVETKQRVETATRKATTAQNAFNDSAKTALTGILGRINPQLGSMATMAVDLAKGLGSASLALLGMVGAGAAVGGLVALFRRMAEAAKEAAEALERQAKALREAQAARAAASLEFQTRVADEARKAGMMGSAPEISTAAMGIMGRGGLEADAAIFGALAQRIAGLTDEQVLRVIGGYLAGGGRAEFTGRAAQDRAMIQALARTPAQEATAARAARTRDVGAAAMAEAAGLGASPEGRVFQAVVEALAARGAVTPEEEAYLRGQGGTEAIGRDVRQRAERRFGGARPAPSWLGGASQERESELIADYWRRMERRAEGLTPEGATRTYGELLGLVRQELQAMIQAGAAGQAPMNVTIYAPVTNVKDQYNATPQAREAQSWIADVEVVNVH